MTLENSEEIVISTLSHARKRSSYALKDPRNRRAVSILPYASHHHPARGHLPVNLDPINLALFNGSWDARWTPAAATDYLLEKIDTAPVLRWSPTRLRCADLK